MDFERSVIIYLGVSVYDGCSYTEANLEHIQVIIKARLFIVQFRKSTLRPSFISARLLIQLTRRVCMLTVANSYILRDAILYEGCQGDYMEA